MPLIAESVRGQPAEQQLTPCSCSPRRGRARPPGGPPCPLGFPHEGQMLPLRGTDTVSYLASDCLLVIWERIRAWPRGCPPEVSSVHLPLRVHVRPIARQHLSWCGRHTTSHTNNPAANTNAQGQRATPSTCGQAGSVGFLGSGSAQLASAHGASDLDMPV